MTKIFTSLSKLVLLLGACAITVPVSSASSQGKANGKSQGKQKVQTKDNHGREAGELPSGLQQYSEKKGELPEGLQKKKTKDGQLTRGLTEGGKKSKSPMKGKKDSK